MICGLADRREKMENTIFQFHYQRGDSKALMQGHPQVGVHNDLRSKWPIALIPFAGPVICDIIVRVAIIRNYLVMKTFEKHRSAAGR